MSPRIHEPLTLDGVPLMRLENESLRVDVAPSVGGRVVSVYSKRARRELLWRNAAQPLVKEAAGSAFDPVFFGGIDELLPNDIPETFGGAMLPDHGELWTTVLHAELTNAGLTLSASLPGSGLHYERNMSLRGDDPVLLTNYRIRNERAEPVQFMFKLHAALPAGPGDRIVCPAGSAEVADAAWSRWKTLEPFPWPMVAGERADVVPWLGPGTPGQVDFLYLSQLAQGKMGWLSESLGLAFEYAFDTKVFPYCWLFASYGGFDGHHTVVLEPCTTKPISLIEASKRRSCTVLQPGETLATQVIIRAGLINDVFDNDIRH